MMVNPLCLPKNMFMHLSYEHTLYYTLGIVNKYCDSVLPIITLII